MGNDFYYINALGKIFIKKCTGDDFYYVYELEMIFTIKMHCTMIFTIKMHRK